MRSQSSLVVVIAKRGGLEEQGETNTDTIRWAAFGSSKVVPARETKHPSRTVARASPRVPRHEGLLLPNRRRLAAPSWVQRA